MTIPWSETQDGDPTFAPMEVIIASVKDGAFPKETPSQVYGYGFTVSRPAGAPPEAVLGEDPLRISAMFMTNLVFYLGEKKDFSSINTTLPATGTAGTGARIPTGLNAPFKTAAQNELWVAFTGATDITVWVERRVPGGRL